MHCAGSLLIMSRRVCTPICSLKWYCSIFLSNSVLVSTYFNNFQSRNSVQVPISLQLQKKISLLSFSLVSVTSCVPSPLLSTLRSLLFSAVIWTLLWAWRPHAQGRNRLMRMTSPLTNYPSSYFTCDLSQTFSHHSQWKAPPSWG